MWPGAGGAEPMRTILCPGETMTFPSGPYHTVVLSNALAVPFVVEWDGLVVWAHFSYGPWARVLKGSA